MDLNTPPQVPDSGDGEQRSAESLPPHPAPPRLSKPSGHTGMPVWMNVLFAAISLYVFLSAINVMGSGLKSLGKHTTWIQDLLAQADNPFVALVGSVLITSIVQSSSFTTALIITLTGAGMMDVDTAIFAVMGANIGTSVTNLIVSLGQMRIRRQFRRGFTAALTHIFVNLLTVLLLFPLEWASSGTNGGLLMRFSTWLAGYMSVGEIDKPFNPVKWVTGPVVHVCKSVVELVTPGKTSYSVVLAILGLVLLFTGLVFLVGNLKGALLRRIEGLFRRVFFRNDGTSFLVGLLSTILVQSSSVTTSLIVPLAGAGAVKLRRVFPFMLGANCGTTMTGVIAATANPVQEAVAVAIAHVTFNVIGTLVWYPMRAVPISLARGYGRIAARSKRYAFLFLAIVFLIVPFVGLVVTEVLINL